MDFRTVVQIPPSGFSIGHTTQLMLVGSCFSENIGNKLSENKFSVDVNPFGVLYNPASVSTTMRRLLQEESFTEKDLIFHNDVYQSFLHHGSFSHPDKQECLALISNRFVSSADFIRKADVLLLTFGTAHVYQLKTDERIVGNCHKFPADAFMRKRLSVEEITEDWTALINEFLTVNRALKLIFTVSPIRHWKDGAHENVVSKSVLHLAIEKLREIYPENAFYFPAYEIMTDELRDYRFYAEDMMHPSGVAIDYIWKRFCETFFSAETIEINMQWQQISRALNHRPLNGKTESYRLFLRRILQKITVFQANYPSIDCRREIEQLKQEVQQ